MRVRQGTRVADLKQDVRRATQFLFSVCHWPELVSALLAHAELALLAAAVERAPSGHSVRGGGGGGSSRHSGAVPRLADAAALSQAYWREAWYLFGQLYLHDVDLAVRWQAPLATLERIADLTRRFVRLLLIHGGHFAADNLLAFEVRPARAARVVRPARFASDIDAAAVSFAFLGRLQVHEAASTAVRHALQRHSPWTLARTVNAAAAVATLAPLPPVGATPAPATAHDAAAAGAIAPAAGAASTQPRPSLSMGLARLFGRRSTMGTSPLPEVPPPPAPAGTAPAAASSHDASMSTAGASTATDDHGGASTASGLSASGSGRLSESAVDLGMASRAVALVRNSTGDRLWACHRQLKAHLRKYRQGTSRRPQGGRTVARRLTFRAMQRASAPTRRRTPRVGRGAAEHGPAAAHAGAEPARLAAAQPWSVARRRAARARLARALTVEPLQGGDGGVAAHAALQLGTIRRERRGSTLRTISGVRLCVACGVTCAPRR